MAFDHNESRVKAISVIQVFKVTSLTGKGEGDSPIREVYDFFTKEGRHICTLHRDPVLFPGWQSPHSEHTGG